MTQWRAQSSPQTFGGDGADRFYAIWGNYDSATEADVQCKAYTDFTFSDLRINVTLVVDTALGGTCHFRDDGVSSSNVAVSFTVTGWDEDVTGSEAVVADSLVGIFLENVGGMHGDDIQIDDSLITFEHASTDAPMLGNGKNSFSTSRFIQLPNGQSTTTEEQNDLRIKRASTWSNLRTVVAVVTGTWTCDIRIDGVSSSNLAISSITSTGAVEDVTGSDTVAVGADVNCRFNEDVSGAITPSTFQVDIDTPESWWGAALNNFTTREYLPFTSRNTGTTSADDNYTAHMGSTTAGNLQTFVTTAGSGTRDVTLRVASTDSTNLTISVTGTGLFEDTTGSEAIADTDNVTASMASTGDSVTVSRVAVELPWSAGGVEVSLTGSQPFSTGALTLVWNISLAGNEPASGGLLTEQQTLQRSLTGNEPAAAGVLTQEYGIALTGSEPASAGNLTRVWNIPLAGSLPASTGALAELQTLLRDLTGNQPASNGALVSLEFAALTGSQPASNGVLTPLQTLLRGLTGSQPASAGVLADILLGRNLTGNWPASAGALSLLWNIPLTGNQPASAGVLAALQTLLRGLAGSQPASAGALAQQYGIGLTGSQPASSGALTALIVLLVALVGSQPASAGALTELQTLLRTLTGSQPASAGALAQQYNIALTGSLPASNGVLTPLQAFLVALAGSQPASAGALALLYGITLLGSQPASAGALLAEIISGAVALERVDLGARKLMGLYQGHRKL